MRQHRRIIDRDEAMERLLVALRNKIVDEYVPVRMRKGYRYIDAERLTSLNSELVRQLLEELAETGKLSRRLTHSLAACPSCGSIDLQLVLTCSKCGSQKVKRGAIYQCIDCKCHFLDEEIRGEGKTRCLRCGIGKPRYLMIGTFYACLNCCSIPVEAVWRSICRSCGQLFSQEESDILELYTYSLEDHNRYESIGEWILSAISRELNDLGFSLRINEEVRGISGVIHRFSIIATDNYSKKIKLAIEIVPPCCEVNEQFILSFVLKVKDIDAEIPIIVTLSKISAETRRLAESQGISIFFARNAPSMPSRLHTFISNLLSTSRTSSSSMKRQLPL